MDREFSETIPALNRRTIAEASPSPPPLRRRDSAASREERAGERRPFLLRLLRRLWEEALKHRYAFDFN